MKQDREANQRLNKTDRPVTLKDVAALAGVSLATASNVMNGGPVSQKARDKVMEAATRLNYVPNKMGRMLMSGKSNLLEMVIMTVEGHPDIVHRTSLFYYLMLGVAGRAEAEGYGLRFTTKSHDDPNLLQYFAQIIGERSVDGIIIIPQFARDYDFLAALRRAQFPHIMLRPEINGQGSNLIDMGDYEGGRLAGQMLIEAGASRVALINGPSSHLCAIERERGLTDVLLQAGLKLTAKKYSDYTMEGGYHAMKEIVADALPDAVFCTNDYMAVGAMQLMNEIGVSIPRDMAFIGYDDSDVATAVSPPLSTLDNRFFDLGEALAEELIAGLGMGRSPASRVILPIWRPRQSHQLGIEGKPNEPSGALA